MNNDDKSIMEIAPRVAFDPDGIRIFFDKDGGEIPTKGTDNEPDMKKVKWLKEKIKVVFIERNPACEIWWRIDNRWYCFKINCTTGALEGIC